MCKLPKFKYHPNPLETGTFKQDETEICDCCEKETEIYYDGGMFAEDEVVYLCPSCIHTGKASDFFNGGFTDWLDNTDSCSEEVIDEIRKRTPTYSSWQEQKWLTHCNDGCAFVGYVGWDEIKDKLEDFSNLESDLDGFAPNLEFLKKYMRNGGDLQGYLFQCLHCQKYRLHADCS